MHVQFVGLPSSGKTTLTKALLSRYPDKYQLAEKKYGSIRSLLMNEPILAIKTISLCAPIILICIRGAMGSSVSLRERLLALIGLVVNLANFKCSSSSCLDDSKVVLWDELLLQRALSVFAYSDEAPRESDIIEFIAWSEKSMTTENVFLHFDASAADRLYERGLPVRMRRLSKKLVGRILETHKTVLSKLVENSKYGILIDTGREFNMCVKDIDLFLTEARVCK